MRGLLIANPNATTTDARIADVLISALRSVITLEAVTTTHRGHAGELAQRAVFDGTEVVITLGGDGTVHEVVNGLLSTGTEHLPTLATIPGGSANVFARTTGLPNDPVAATGAILAALRQRRLRTIGLGRANGTYFTCNAGLGLDAEVVSSMEHQRADGKAATPARYVATAVGQYFRHTDRSPVGHAFLALVQNCSPWTYMGAMPVNGCPDASFETGLDVLALRDMRVLPSLRTVGRILRNAKGESTSKSLYLGHDLQEFAITADRDVAFQIDGEGLPRTRHVRFESVPHALQIVDCRGPE